MHVLRWETVRDEFAFDGSWRDIYVLNTDMSLWQRMLDRLRADGYELAYSRDGDLVQLPTRAETIFGDNQCARLLAVRFGGVQANCHFFTSDEIEFDIDPREVTSQPQLDALLQFLRDLAMSVGRQVILCPENTPDFVILHMSPEGTTGYHPSGK